MAERLTPEGQSKRQRAKELLFTAVAAAIGGGTNAALDIDWHNLKTPAEKIDHFRTGKGGFDRDDAFHAAAAERVVGDEQYSRAEYVQHIFSNTTPVKMPESIRDKLAILAPGIPAQESRYNNNLPPSRSNARYIWQLSVPAIDHLNRILKTNVKLEDTQALKVATPLVFAYFDRIIYPAIEGPAKRALAAFGLAEHPEAVEQFLTYCMINAYNAGPTRLAQMLGTVAEKYSPRHIHHAYEYTPLSLFHAMAELGLRPPGELNAGYKYEAGEYVFRVLAGAESLHGDAMLKYEKTLPQKVADGTKHSIDALLQEVLKPAVTGIAGGFVGGVAAQIASNPTLGSVVPELSRRTVVGGAVAGAVGVVAHHAYKGNIAVGFPDIRQWMWWQKTEQQPELSTIFTDGTIYKPKAARERLRAFGHAKLLPNAVKSYNRADLPVRNLTTSGVIAELKRLSSDGSLHRITKKDVEGNTAHYQALSFTVDAVSKERGWRCRGVGMGASQSGVNDPKYLRLVPRAGTVLEDVDAAFKRGLENAGLPKRWRVRLIVNSLLRSDSAGGTNKSVVGASRNSPHVFGVGIDISLSKFDIIDTETQEFFMTSATPEDRIADAPLVKKLNDILAGVLMNMHGKDFTLTFEPKADHYHISAIVPPKKIP